MDIRTKIKDISMDDEQYQRDLYEMHEKFKDDDRQTLVGAKNYIYMGFGHETPLRPRVKAAFAMIDLLLVGK